MNNSCFQNTANKDYGLKCLKNMLRTIRIYTVEIKKTPKETYPQKLKFER